MENELKFIFNNVNDWLKFAEAKLAGIVVFNAAILIAIIQVFNNGSHLDFLIKVAFISQFLSNFLSLFFSLWGLSPIVNRIKLKCGKIDKDDNIFFWRDIIKYNEEKYLLKLKNHLPQLDVSNGWNNHIVNQIIHNSRTTERKYEIFNLSVKLTLIGFLASFITLISWLFF